MRLRTLAQVLAVAVLFSMTAITAQAQENHVWDFSNAEDYTYNGALERDFHAVLLRNGITSYQGRYTRLIQEICNIVSYSTLRFLLSQETEG